MLRWIAGPGAWCRQELLGTLYGTAFPMGAELDDFGCLKSIEYGACSVSGHGLVYLATSPIPEKVVQLPSCG